MPGDAFSLPERWRDGSVEKPISTTPLPWGEGGELGLGRAGAAQQPRRARRGSLPARVRAELRGLAAGGWRRGYTKLRALGLRAPSLAKPPLQAYVKTNSLCPRDATPSSPLLRGHVPSQVPQLARRDDATLLGRAELSEHLPPHCTPHGPAWPKVPTHPRPHPSTSFSVYGATSPLLQDVFLGES